MSYYAMVVVVEADGADDAPLSLPDLNGEDDECLFVGDAWEVERIDQYPDHEIEGGPRGPIYEPEFDTVACIRAHPYVAETEAT